MTTHPHGSRNRYLNGCRCDDCRAANAAHAKQRRLDRAAGKLGPYVDATVARARLHWLTRHGIGRDAVHWATGIPLSTLHAVRTGRRNRLAREAEAKILAVTLDMALDRARISAGPTWDRLRELLEEGYTIRRINRALGYRAPRHIPIGKQLVTVRNAARVERLHREWTT